jgi:glycosyltransferase involved in cell wall biosynthesis
MTPKPSRRKRIVQIGNWPPPVCSWTMSLVELRKELEARGWDCVVMNLNENRRLKSPEYIDVQGGWDYGEKVSRYVAKGYAVHVRVNGETRKGYLLALAALGLARLFFRPALLTYAGGHQQSFFPAPRSSFRHWAFALLFSVPHRIFCNSDKVKGAILTTGIRQEVVVPIPHFSTQHLEYTTVPLPAEVEDFYRRHRAVFFAYVCLRKEYALDFLAETIRHFRKLHPDIGFMLAGVRDREMEPMRDFIKKQELEAATCVVGSVPHELFLTLLSRSVAYIRTPVTDGICSSVLESLILKTPVLASENGARPQGVEPWKEGDMDSLLSLMEEAVAHHDVLVSRIPKVEVEDNAKKLADSIEEVCLKREDRYDPFLPSASKA